MLVLKAYKTELSPTEVQVTFFNKCAGTSRFIYNWGLNQRIKLYEESKKSISFFNQRNFFNSIKDKEFPWIREIPYSVVENSLEDLSKAFKSFFESQKKKKKVGFPKFKRKHRKKSFRLRGCIHAYQSKIKLPIIGLVNLKEAAYIPSNKKIKSVTLSERAGRWFLSALVEESIEVPINNGPRFSIDLGITNFAVDSNGDCYNSPKPLRKNIKKLRRLCRRFSHKHRGSKNQEKTRKKLAKLHFRISCIRKDFLHKLSTTLTKTKSTIVVETLTVKMMMRNHKLARAISDESWSSFISMLSYKSIWYGCNLVKAPRDFPSTKRCSKCGNIKNKMSLSKRTYTCEVCDLVISRDYNSALNLLSLAEPL